MTEVSQRELDEIASRIVSYARRSQGGKTLHQVVVDELRALLERADSD